MQDTEGGPTFPRETWAICVLPCSEEQMRALRSPRSASNKVGPGDQGFAGRWDPSSWLDANAHPRRRQVRRILLPSNLPAKNHPYFLTNLP